LTIIFIKKKRVSTVGAPVALGGGESPFPNLPKPLRFKNVHRVVFATGLERLTLQNR